MNVENACEVGTL